MKYVIFCGMEIIHHELEFVPEKYEVTEYIVATYGCSQCKQTEEPCFMKDGAFPVLIEKSYGTPPLVDSIMKNKFILCLSLYRQEQERKRSDILVTRVFMAAWTILIFQLCFQYFLQQKYRKKLGDIEMRQMNDLHKICK